MRGTKIEKEVEIYVVNLVPRICEVFHSRINLASGD
jgi:hypothetical protein